jgi:hypothetical protein
VTPIPGFLNRYVQSKTYVAQRAGRRDLLAGVTCKLVSLSVPNPPGINCRATFATIGALQSCLTQYNLMP